MAKRPRSEAQRAASRANGQRSQGPRTAQGKARSYRNALRHGLRATSLDALPLAPDQAASRLVEAVHRRLAPSDVIEHELADTIAMAFWRLRRARALEAALDGDDRDLRTDTVLAKAFVGRTSGPSALALLFRYRNQAIGELSRCFRLLEVHRDAGRGATPGTAEHAAAGRAAARPANDNRSFGTADGSAAPERPLS